MKKLIILSMLAISLNLNGYHQLEYAKLTDQFSVGTEVKPEGLTPLLDCIISYATQDGRYNLEGENKQLGTDYEICKSFDSTWGRDDFDSNKVILHSEKGWVTPEKHTVVKYAGAQILDDYDTKDIQNALAAILNTEESKRIPVKYKNLYFITKETQKIEQDAWLPVKFYRNYIGS